MTTLLPLTFVLLSLLGSASVITITESIKSLGRTHVYSVFKKKPLYIYSIITKQFPTNPWKSFLVLLYYSQILFLISYSISGYYLIDIIQNKTHFNYLTSAIFLFIIYLIINIVSQTISSTFPQRSIKTSLPFCNPSLIVWLPITYLILTWKQRSYKKLIKHTQITPFITIKHKILDLINESELALYLDSFDKHIITSLASMRERIVREVMIPRVNMFAIPASQTLHDATQQLTEHRYSRIPVYQENLDTIIGVLLYKDIIEYYIQYENHEVANPKETPIKDLIKPVLYTPETKKIPYLLQEFRRKHIHLAIVVDEYGGTEGLVTIEDILEELVGEISDEHDPLEEPPLYKPHPQEGFIVDGTMPIVDIAETLNIHIPNSTEYDTLSGYIFKQAGTVPQKGWGIHTDTFKLKILVSNEKMIKKIHIIPVNK